MICLSCDGEEPQAGMPPALLARARAIEAAREGERATEAEWLVFAGVASGSLPWAVTLRLMECADAAAGMGRSLLVCR